VHRVDFVREVMNVAFVHLDLRHYRSYFSDAVHPMTGDVHTTSSTLLHTPVD
jgi:hypothetical protein